MLESLYDHMLNPMVPQNSDDSSGCGVNFNSGRILLQGPMLSSLLHGAKLLQDVASMMLQQVQPSGELPPPQDAGLTLTQVGYYCRALCLVHDYTGQSYSRM